MPRKFTKQARTVLRWLATIRSFLPKRHGARIITYHSVRPIGMGLRSAYVVPEDFSDQIESLLAHGYQIISLSTLVDRLRQGQDIPENWVCITFDDGYVDNYRYAFPVLKRLGVPAAIFLITGKTNRDSEFLSLAQIKEMSAHGIEFGAHTVDHVSLISVPLVVAHHQIMQSKQDLETWLKVPVAHFCYPFGHYDLAFEDLVREAGLISCSTEHAGVIRRGVDPFRLVRVGVLGTDTARDFQLKITGAYDWWINTFMMLEAFRRWRKGRVSA
jgi:peptidoglycan/xylan/chitin deacetylase (PgdA/CDA1 family)